MIILNNEYQLLHFFGRPHFSEAESRWLAADQGAISSEDVVIESLPEAWLRRKGERLGGSWRGTQGRRRGSWFRMHAAQEGSGSQSWQRVRVGNLWYMVPQMVGSDELPLPEGESIPAGEEGASSETGKEGRWRQGRRAGG